jgi:hypothetical protein
VWPTLVTIAFPIARVSLKLRSPCAAADDTA